MASARVYTQDALEDLCTSSGVQGISFTKDPVFMLPLRNLRSALNRPEYRGHFRREILNLVGSHKEHQLLHSSYHDFLVVATLTGEGMAYPDAMHTSAVKAPVELRELPLVRSGQNAAAGEAEAIPTGDSRPPPAEIAVEYGDTYPFRDGDFHDVVTLDLLRVPVVTNTGYIMEQSTVESLLKQRSPCPNTRQPLTGATELDRADADKEYALHNGPCKLGGDWLAKLRALRKQAGLRELHRLRRIPTYRDFKTLVEQAQQTELSDERFAEILEEDFDAHVSSAAPRRRMALGSELFGVGVQVEIEQFRKREVWPHEGDTDFFVVLPQPNIHKPYAIPLAGRDSDGLPFPPNYYRSEAAA